MAMNFWAAQKRARSHTSLYVTIFIMLTFLVAYIAEEAMVAFAAPEYNPPLPYVGLTFLAITFCVALFQYAMFRSQGGSYVAESLGARRIEKHSASMREQMLLNIVEEVALAASLPIPAVYVLDAKEINAFAAGMNTEDAAVTVTQGTLQLLNRDELQGVIAHECGHIRNGDMLISMRMAAMVMGFFCVLYIAMRILQVASYRTNDNRGGDDNRRGGNPLVLAALILSIAGAFTWFFGSILKSCISREREYLADASAVQFTRNPDGIANALRKIEKTSFHDMPKDGIAFSHMYFEDRSFMSALFATHPPLKKRIEAIEGREYIPEEWNIPKET